MEQKEIMKKAILINVLDENKKIIGKGLIHFNNSEVNLIKGFKSKSIEVNIRI